MGIGRIIGGTVAGLGMVGLGYTGIAGTDDTTRDEAGAIVEEGEVGAFRIQVGDCLITPDGATEIESVQGVPCSEPHSDEVYHAFNIAGSVFPGDEAVGLQADQGCYEAFESFVGATYEESIYDFGAIYPTAGSWNELGDREVLCTMYLYAGGNKTGSAQGTAQ